jgi:hypothetical protein
MKAVQGGKKVLLTERGRLLAVVKPICGGETESIFRGSKPVGSCVLHPGAAPFDASVLVKRYVKVDGSVASGKLL